MDDVEALRKGFLRDFMAGLGWGRQPKPFMPRVRRDAGPHAGRLAREASENVARGRWTRGQAQGALDRSFAPQAAEVRQPPRARGSGGAGFSGGVSRTLGAPAQRAWVAPKPPPLGKATSLPADEGGQAPASGDSPMDDAQLRELVARETATPHGRRHFDNIMEGLEAVGKAWANPLTRGAAEEVLAKWTGEDALPLRKALSGAWLARAKRIAAGTMNVAGRAGERVGEAVAGNKSRSKAMMAFSAASSQRHRDLNQAVNRMGRAEGINGVRETPGFKGNVHKPRSDDITLEQMLPRKARPLTPEGAKLSVRWANSYGRRSGERRYPSQEDWHRKTDPHVSPDSDAKRAIISRAARKAGGAAYEASIAGDHARWNRMGRRAAAGVAASAAAGVAAYAAGRALSEKQREQRKNAAKARWANRPRAPQE